MYKYVRTRTHLIEIGYYECPKMSALEFDKKFGAKEGASFIDVFQVENVLSSFNYYARTDRSEGVLMSVGEAHFLVNTVIGIKSEIVEPWSYSQMCEWRMENGM